MTVPATSDVQGIFDQLLERGGAAVLGVGGCAIVRAAAVASAAADLDARSAATAAALLAQLPAARPAQPTASTSNYDLEALEDRELDGLHYLLSRCERFARGCQPKRPDRRLRGGRAETPREHKLRELGRRWDEIEHEGRQLSADEARELGEAIAALLPRKRRC